MTLHLVDLLTVVPDTWSLGTGDHLLYHWSHINISQTITIIQDPSVLDTGFLVSPELFRDDLQMNLFLGHELDIPFTPSHITHPNTESSQLFNQDGAETGVHFSLQWHST